LINAGAELSLSLKEKHEKLVVLISGTARAGKYPTRGALEAPQTALED